MSTLFISWPAACDADFRSAYEAITGESIQQNPACDRSGALFMIGTSRATAAQCEALVLAGFDALRWADDPDALGSQPLEFE